jgi:hypothetical protein
LLKINKNIKSCAVTKGFRVSGKIRRKAKGERRKYNKDKRQKSQVETRSVETPLRRGQKFKKGFRVSGFAFGELAYGSFQGFRVSGFQALPAVFVGRRSTSTTEGRSFL